MIAASTVVALMCAAPLFGSPTPRPVDPWFRSDDASARLASLRRDARDASLDLEARRRAAESLLDAMRERVAASPTDGRAGQWLADAAEECFITVLPLGGDLDSVLFGLPSHDEWQRVTTMIAVMLDLSARAEVQAAAEVARLSDPSKPLDAAGAALLDLYETVEVPRRIPLLRGLAEALAAVVVERDDSVRRPLARSALDRLDRVLEQVDGEALLHAASAAMLAAGESGDASAAASLARLHDVARGAANDAASKRRVEIVAAFSRAALGERAAALAQLRSLEERSRAEASAGDFDAVARRIALAEARLRRDATRQAAVLDGRHWTTPLEEVLSRVPSTRRDATRIAILARLTDDAQSDAGKERGAPLLNLAAAELFARGGDDDQSLERAESALAAIAPDDPWRVASLEASARAFARLGRYADAAARLLERADRFRGEPEAVAAIERSVSLARLADDGHSGSSSRTALRKTLEVAITAFPNHPRRTLWRVERGVIDAESIAASEPLGATHRESMTALTTNLRAAMASLADDEETRLLLVRWAIARATVSLAALDAEDALAALDAAPPPVPAGAHAAALLGTRVLSLALADRDLLADPVIIAARPAADAVLRSAGLEALQRIAPAPAPGAPPISDPRRRAAVIRIVALLDDINDIDEVVDINDIDDMDDIDVGLQTSVLVGAEALRAADWPAAALPRYRALRRMHPDRADLLLGEAESLIVLPIQAADERARIAEALAIYQRLLAGREYAVDAADRTPMWWLCQLRQLECLVRAGDDRERIAARVERLRSLDPSLGGAAFAVRFEALSTREQ